MKYAQGNECYITGIYIHHVHAWGVACMWSNNDLISCLTCIYICTWLVLINGMIFWLHTFDITTVMLHVISVIFT